MSNPSPITPLLAATPEQLRLARQGLGSQDWSQALADSLLYDQADRLETLLDHCSQAPDPSSVLVKAAELGSNRCVAFLLSRSSDRELNAKALGQAAYFGHDACVELLIPAADASFDDYAPLRLAVISNYPRCVELLIPFSDLGARNFSALRIACNYNLVSCAQLLMDADPPTPDLLLELETQSQTPRKQRLLELLTARRESQELEKAALAPDRLRAARPSL